MRWSYRTAALNDKMAELSKGSEEEQSQEPVALPVNYSPEVEAAIQEVVVLRSRAIL